jgi:hypothetical protein
VAVLPEEIGKCRVRVFTFKGSRLRQLHAQNRKQIAAWGDPHVAQGLNHLFRDAGFKHVAAHHKQLRVDLSDPRAFQSLTAIHAGSVRVHASFAALTAAVGLTFLKFCRKFLALRLPE